MNLNLIVKTTVEIYLVDMEKLFLVTNLVMWY
jgi:hypothetical protein